MLGVIREAGAWSHPHRPRSVGSCHDGLSYCPNVRPRLESGLHEVSSAKVKSHVLCIWRPGRLFFFRLFDRCRELVNSQLNLVDCS